VAGSGRGQECPGHRADRQREDAGAFLWPGRPATGQLPPTVLSVLYLSPLKALNNDIRNNLLRPLAGLREKWRESGETSPTSGGDAFGRYERGRSPRLPPRAARPSSPPPRRASPYSQLAARQGSRPPYAWWCWTDPRARADQTGSSSWPR
jgi:hypothetical protein